MNNFSPSAIGLYRDAGSLCIEMTIDGSIESSVTSRSLLGQPAGDVCVVMMMMEFYDCKFIIICWTSLLMPMPVLLMACMRRLERIIIVFNVWRMSAKHRNCNIVMKPAVGMRRRHRNTNRSRVAFFQYCVAIGESFSSGKKIAEKKRFGSGESGQSSPPWPCMDCIHILGWRVQTYVSRWCGKHGAGRVCGMSFAVSRRYLRLKSIFLF